MTLAKFVREVRSEASKINWPSRKETSISTIMVLLLGTIASVFFVFVDFAIGKLVNAILGL